MSKEFNTIDVMNKRNTENAYSIKLAREMERQLECSLKSTASYIEKIFIKYLKIAASRRKKSR